MKKVLINVNPTTAAVNRPAKPVQQKPGACNTDSIALTSLAQIDNFSTNFPACTTPRYLIIDGTAANPAITNDTSFTDSPNTTFYFFVLATDSAGNTELLRPDEVVSVYFGGGILPVTGLYFKGSTQGKNNLLEWATAAEQNSREFKIERFLNGAIFNTIGSVAAAGNSNQAANYQYKDYTIDRLNSKVIFYRLKQFDKNGATQYSNTVRLSYSESAINKSMVYPNPAVG